MDLEQRYRHAVPEQYDLFPEPRKSLWRFVPAMVIADSVVRLIPGVLGGDASAEIESYSQGDLDEVEFPQYTRPETFRDMKVPDVLLSGNHAEIEKWRKSQSELKSRELDK